MDVINLLNLLKVRGDCLKNVKVYGKARSEISAPKALGTGVFVPSTNKCILVDIFAVDLSSLHYELSELGIISKTDIFFVNASMSTYVDRSVILDDWYKFEGDLRLSKNTKSPVIAMFKFYKPTTRESTAKWGIRPTIVRDFDTSEFKETPRVFEYMSMSLQVGGILVPEEVTEMPKCLADEPDLRPGSDTLQSFGTNREVSQNTDTLDFGEQVERPTYDSPSDTVQIAQNRVETENGVREQILPISQNVEILEGVCKVAYENRMKVVAELRKKYAICEDSATEYIKELFDRIKSNLTSRVNLAQTGQAILKDYMQQCSAECTKKYMGSTIEKCIIDDIDDIFNYCLYQQRVVADGKLLKFIKNYFSSAEMVYAGLVSVMLGVSMDTLHSLVRSCTKFEVSFSRVLNNNPYALMLFSGSFSFAQAEYLAMCLGLAGNRELIRDRNIGIIQQAILDDNTNSTCFAVWRLRNTRKGITLSKGKYEKLANEGTYLSAQCVGNIKAFLNPVIRREVWGYRDIAWQENKYTKQYVGLPNSFDFNQAMQDFLDEGLGVKFKIGGTEWTSLARIAEKELFIYKRAHELSEEREGALSDIARIDTLIAEYEQMEGIVLEERQKQAVHLVRNNIFAITGAAGSGKTTVAKCIVYVIEHYIEGEDFNPIIQFAAPTGKAAKRMHEVIGRSAKTEHSLFRIGIKQDYGVFEAEDEGCGNTADWYIFDEQSMVTVDLMYKALLQIPDSARVIFIGDICQLPPIGKGLPFKNFLSFLPMVELNVSKRSAEGSGITYNAHVINKYSELHNLHGLKETNDFKIVECGDENIPTVVSLLCKHYLGTLTETEKRALQGYVGSDRVMQVDGITADDIQVVSPLAKAGYTWGCANMNIALQDVFNPIGRRFAVKYPYAKDCLLYRIGDRVIHTKNNESLQWYASYGNGKFVKAWGNGVVNGDVGYIEAIVSAKDCVFENQVEEKPDGYELPSELREDKTWCKAGNYFVVVKYIDYESNRPFYVLYRVSESQDNGFGYNEIVYTAGDMEYLQLFYCGTVHKLQGSQNKMIINVLGSGNFGKFLTRNMIYTAETRASDVEYIVGNVGDVSASQLSRARLIVADESVNTIGGLLCGF